MAKKKKAKTIGEMTNSRGVWLLNPVTKIVENKKVYKRKKFNYKGDNLND